MAASRSSDELTEIAGFLNGLYALGGFATWKEFADEAGVHPTQVSSYVTANAEASGLSLLRLIQAAADRADGDAAGLSIRLAKETTNNLLVRLEVHLAEVETGVADLLQGQTRILHRIEESRGGERKARQPATQKPKAKPQ